MSLALVNVRPDTRSMISVEEVRLFDRASEPLDVLIYCSDELANMRRRIPPLSGFLRSGGRMWIGHPEEGSSLSTDITSDDVSEIAGKAGLDVVDSIVLGEWRLDGFLKP
jgi:hypothetical protein